MPPMRQTLGDVPFDEEKWTILELATKLKQSPKPSEKVLGSWVRFSSEEVQDDKEAMLAAVSSRPALLRYCSERLRKDPEVVFEGLQQHPQDLEFACQSLRAAKDFMLKAVQAKGQSLCYASKELRNDEEVVLAAVEQDGSSLQYASDAARRIRKVVVAAVQHHGSSLQYASAELKGDLEVVQMAVKSDVIAWRFASEGIQGKIQNDQELWLQIVEEDFMSLLVAPEGPRADLDVVMKALVKASCCPSDRSFQLWECIDPQLKPSNEDIAMLAMRCSRKREHRIRCLEAFCEGQYSPFAYGRLVLAADSPLAMPGEDAPTVLVTVRRCCHPRDLCYEATMAMSGRRLLWSEDPGSKTVFELCDDLPLERRMVEADRPLRFFVVLDFVTLGHNVATALKPFHAGARLDDFAPAWNTMST